MKKLSFYDIDKDYIDYLQNTEIEKRGFTRVPNMSYEGKEQKFLCGIVLNINDMNYYVPVTSNCKQYKDNIRIVFKDDKYKKVKGSLRFNYMVPAPKEVIKERIINNEPDKKRRMFLQKELEFCNSIQERIYKQAKKTYNSVIKGNDKNLNQNACDFKLLETLAKEYSKPRKSLLERKDMINNEIEYER